MSEIPPFVESSLWIDFANNLLFMHNFSSWNNLRWKKWNSARIYAFYRFLVRVTIVGKNKRLSLFFSYLVKRRIETGI